MKKPIEGNGKFRRFVMIQLAKMQKVYMPASLMLLVLTNSLLFIPYFENRDIHPYLSVFFVSSFLFLLLLSIAHIYVRKFGMNQFQHRADVELNPFTVNHLSPLDEVRWRTFYLPSMTTYYKILENINKDDSYLPVLKQEIDKIQRWVNLGYIPPDDAPDHLKALFSSIVEMRL
jgi:hypothetical protein